MMLLAKKRLNFELEMQYKAPTECGKSIGTREERWGLGWEQG